MRNRIFVLLASSWLVVMGLSTKVHAQCSGWDGLGCGVTVGMAVQISAPSLITLIGNSVRLAENKHAPGWGTTGLISGLIGVATHTMILATSGSGSSSGFVVAVNASMLGLNVATLAVSIANLANLQNTRRTRFRWGATVQLPKAPTNGVVIGQFR
ncbi:MAG: hypothetical protein EP343_02385 [Deltaproteobacteria bacterium]|nr:MAG: hypothetical protein EP343_02385 [Deltaproteobacteria bacterium]